MGAVCAVGAAWRFPQGASRSARTGVWRSGDSEAIRDISDNACLSATEVFALVALWTASRIFAT